MNCETLYMHFNLSKEEEAKFLDKQEKPPSVVLSQNKGRETICLELRRKAGKV